ncbi:MAG: type I restriction endonuclease subunit R [Nocardiopsaceae bacterium]|nr:type I restriction endonuclease subunit R [Nocardiopsaceae bacterium]
MSGTGAGSGVVSGRPVSDLLRILGWSEIITAEPSSEVPEDGRVDYRDELLLDRFREQLRLINPGPGGDTWLDDQRLDRVCGQVRRAAEIPDLAEANKEFTELLLQGLVVPGLPGWDGGRNRRIRLVDWDDAARNDLRVIRNFRLDRHPDGGSTRVVLDYVLFVNGLPLAVVRDPAPDRAATVSESIADLRSYTGARQDGPVESIRRLFAYAQVLVATDGAARAKLGTVTSAPEHFAEWKTTEPASARQIRDEFGVPPERLSGLERLAAGVLRPAHLLDLVRNFTAFRQADDRMMKLVARYPQFKAVHRIIRGLLSGTPGTLGRRDERGGVVWHTQGSGKSYTMAFLVRKLRTTLGLSDFKVVVAVDRVDLRTQLGDSLALAGETIYEAAGVRHAQDLLSDDVPNVVLIMMQHAQRDDATPGTPREPERLGDDPLDDRVSFPELTQSQRVVVIADEAHRTQQGWLHARLRRGLPGAAWIGFTGTPLTREDQRRQTTTGIFGGFFDTYTLRDSVADNATVPIRYEQRRSEEFIVDRAVLDAEYERDVGGTPEDREARQRQQVTTRRILEAEDLIAAKARDMLRHWVSAVLPNGFKAQVAAASRLAAVRYRAALLRARDDLVAELTAYGTAKAQDPESVRDHPDRDFLDPALPFLPLLRVIDFVPVISAGERRDPRTGEVRRDPPDWARWTAETSSQAHVDRFKERLPAPETIGVPGRPAVVPGAGPWTETQPGPEPGARGVGPWDQTPVQPDTSMNYGTAGPWDSAPGQGEEPAAGPAPIAFIIVQARLLTGFDAPVEQVLYLDRPIRDVELLQAIARVNRPARLKTVGLVVDYAGVSRYLDAALAMYDEEDIRGAKTFLGEDDVPRLREARDAVRDFLAAHGIGSLTDAAEADKLLIALEDQGLRNEFDDLVNDFFAYLDRVLPRPEALGYEDDAREFAAAQYRVRRLFRDTRSGGLDPYSYGAKVRRLIDEHLRVIGIAQRIPPVEITAADFREQIAAIGNPRVRAMEMQHALRRHVAEHQATDPAYYQRFSDRLDQLLEQLRDNAESLAIALEELVRQARERDSATVAGDLDPRTERPVRSALEQALAQSLAGGQNPDVRPDRIDELSRQIAVEIVEAVRAPHFTTSVVLQENLRKRVVFLILNTDMYTRQQATRASQDILALARANRDFYLRRGGESDE